MNGKGPQQTVFSIIGQLNRLIGEDRVSAGLSTLLERAVEAKASIDNNMESVLSMANVPTHNEVARLSRKVDILQRSLINLTRKVDELALAAAESAASASSGAPRGKAASSAPLPKTRSAAPPAKAKSVAPSAGAKSTAPSAKARSAAPPAKAKSAASFAKAEGPAPNAKAKSTAPSAKAKGAAPSAKARGATPSARD